MDGFVSTSNGLLLLIISQYGIMLGPLKFQDISEIPPTKDITFVTNTLEQRQLHMTFYSQLH